MYVSCFYSLLSSHSPFCLFVCLFPVALSVCSYRVKKAVVQYAYTTGHNCCLSVFQQYKTSVFYSHVAQNLTEALSFPVK